MEPEDSSRTRLPLISNWYAIQASGQGDVGLPTLRATMHGNALKFTAKELPVQEDGWSLAGGTGKNGFFAGGVVMVHG